MPDAGTSYKTLLYGNLTELIWVDSASVRGRQSKYLTETIQVGLIDREVKAQNITSIGPVAAHL